MIIARHTSTIDVVLAEARRGLVGDHAVEVRNVAEYAVYLHAKEGFSVLNDGIFQNAVRESINKRLKRRNRQGEMLRDSDVVEGFGKGAGETVSYYQSVIGTTDKPGKVKLPPRPKHPGEWADDTEKLAGSYQSRVDSGAYRRYDYA